LNTVWVSVSRPSGCLLVSKEQKPAVETIQLSEYTLYMFIRISSLFVRDIPGEAEPNPKRPFLPTASPIGTYRTASVSGAFDDNIRSEKRTRTAFVWLVFVYLFELRRRA
jgi:hypothetical protein